MLTKRPRNSKGVLPNHQIDGQWRATDIDCCEHDNASSRIGSDHLFLSSARMGPGRRVGPVRRKPKSKSVLAATVKKFIRGTSWAITMLLVLSGFISSIGNGHVLGWLLSQHDETARRERIAIAIEGAMGQIAEYYKVKRVEEHKKKDGSSSRSALYSPSIAHDHQYMKAIRAGSEPKEVCLLKAYESLDEFLPDEQGQGIKENPLVCIIVTTFNVQDYVERSLQSILQQTYSTFEVIVVDDASTDSTQEKVKRFVQADNRFHMLDLKHNTAGGTGQPSNIGLDFCSEDAQYVLFADGDDWMERDALGSLLSGAIRSNSDLTIADFDTFEEVDSNLPTEGTHLSGFDLFNKTSIMQFYNESSSSLTSPFNFESSYDGKYWRKLPTELPFNYYTHPDVLHTSPVPWRKLYSRSFIERNKIRFLEGDYFFEDNAFHWFTVGQARRIHKIDKVLFHHRKNRIGQTTSSLMNSKELTEQSSNQNQDNLDINIGDIVKVKRASKNKRGEKKWDWFYASVDAVHGSSHGQRYDVTRLFDHTLRKGLTNQRIMTINQNEYWKKYFAASRQSGYIPNFHSIGKKFFTGFEFNELDVCAQVGISIFAKNFFKKMKSSNYIADPRLPGIHSKVRRQLENEYVHWHSALARSGFTEFKRRNQQTSRVDLSIIVPTKDVVLCIHDLLSALYNDLTKSKIQFEVFACDDGSVDGTLEILRSFAIEHPLNFYLLESGKESGAGRARNNAIKGLIEGKHVYFADADDKFNFAALAQATQAASENDIDVMVLPYKTEFVHANYSEVDGMMKEDRRIWDYISMKRGDSKVDTKLAALKLINYPWKQLTASSLIHEVGTFFGPTSVQNDVQFHWTSIAAAQNVQFYYQTICTHRKFDSSVRTQLTHLQDYSRLSMLDALGMTQRALAIQGAFDQEDGSRVFEVYKQFFRSLTKWSKKRVPVEDLAYFNRRKNHFSNALDQLEPQKLGSWAYWKDD